VQSDILKEDQAQNTCILSTEFALRSMGDPAKCAGRSAMQEHFIAHNIRNYYSVSISWYHPSACLLRPAQLNAGQRCGGRRQPHLAPGQRAGIAFTLANGFTYVEYYLSRGMDINAFAPNLSFFFSNGMDPEHAVMGRVARRRGASEFAGLMP